MKPKRIILLRHGESEGNVDKTIYTRKPDWKLELTERGKQQAGQARAHYQTIVGDVNMDDCEHWDFRDDEKDTVYFYNAEYFYYCRCLAWNT